MYFCAKYIDTQIKCFFLSMMFVNFIHTVQSFDHGRIMQAKQNWENPDVIGMVRQSVYTCFQKQENTCSLFVSLVVFFKTGVKKKE